jgi:hypothetical protein
MYLRRVSRKKRGKDHGYWALVESCRTARGPRQRVVAYLGDVEEEHRLGVAQAASGQPYQKDLFTGKTPEWVEVDASRVRIERARSFGGAWLALHLMKKLSLDTFLKEKLSVGRALVPWHLVAQILVVQRLLDPSSELSIAEGGYEKCALSDLLGVPCVLVNDDRLYRALDRLLVHKAALEEHLRNRLGELFGISYDLLLYDVTSTFFEGQAQRNPQAARGYSRDHRGDCKQVTIALVVSREGFPLGYEVFDGNRSDVTTVQEIVVAMESRYGQADRVWVMDRGMASRKNFEFLEKENRHYILGTRKGSLKSFESQLREESGWASVREGLEVKLCPLEGSQETYILCRSADRRQKESAMRARFTEEIEGGLTKLAQSCQKKKLAPKVAERRVGRLLGKNTRAEKLFEVQVKTRPDGGALIVWKSKPERMAWSELSEGCYMLRTNIADWSGPDLWNAYMQLTQAEAAFRICKSELELRPVWHQKQERVNAHIFVCFLFYVLWKTLAIMCQQAGIGDSPRKLLDEISAIQVVDVVLPTRGGPDIRKRCVSLPEPHLACLLQKLKLDLPNYAELHKL